MTLDGSEQFESPFGILLFFDVLFVCFGATVLLGDHIAHALEHATIVPEDFFMDVQFREFQWRAEHLSELNC